MSWLASLALLSIRSTGARIERTGSRIRIWPGSVEPEIVLILKLHRPALEQILDQEEAELEWLNRPVPPLPDWKPGQVHQLQEYYIMDVFGEKITIPVHELESLISYNKSIKR